MVSIVDVLNQWQAAGVFDYVLPFLLIFAVVFGILTSTNIIGKQKGVHVIVALVVGLLALRLGFVQEFFAQLFPRLAVGIAIILALLIMTGLFINDNEVRYWMYGFAVVGVITWIVILLSTSDSIGWFGFGGGFIGDYAGLIIGVVLVIGVIIAVVATKGPGDKDAGRSQRHVFNN